MQPKSRSRYCSTATMPQKMGLIRRYEFGRDVGILEGNPDLALVADFDSADDWRAYAVMAPYMAP
ncbi:MAG: hypothetical protein WEE53_06330 [Acidimicrobiia bacterium]